MLKVTIVVRDVGRLNPQYSLDFEMPEVPAIGSYVSIQRPNEPEPYGEDMIVEKVWWRLKTTETGSHRSDQSMAGVLTEIIVECIQATGPYSSDKWQDRLQAHRDRGHEVPEFDVARMSIRQDGLNNCE